MKIKEKKDRKKSEKEEIKLYTIFCEKATEEYIRRKEITIIYDEIIPDMFVKIPVKDNKYVEEIKYDIYADRIKRIRVKFPNGKRETFKISKIEEKIHKDGLYSVSWLEPYIVIKYCGMNIELSIIDLILDEGVKVYLLEYDLNKENNNGK